MSSLSADPAVRPLRRILLEHCSAVLVVAIVLIGLALLLTSSSDTALHPTESRGAAYLAIEGIDWSNPLHRELFRETYRLLRHAGEAATDSLLREIEEARIVELTDPARKLGGERKTLTWDVLVSLVPMYGSFLLVFLCVLVFTYGAARAAAIRKFVMMKQGNASYLKRYWAAIASGGAGEAIRQVPLLLKACVHGAASFLLFSPAYVVAYSLRTRIDTSNAVFLVLLAVATNGVLVHYAGRLFALLVSESRRGYVETALVKGLRGRYRWNHRDGLSRSVIATPLQAARGHVFHAIYKNAALQFIPSMKEHVTFIVTGIVIIEMALNIKGHLCYALLQHILFKEYDIAVAIVFLIFLAVKGVEVGIDVWHHLELRRYDNAA